MGCSIKDIREADIYEATRKFVGNAKSFKVIKPGQIELRIGGKFTSKGQLMAIARSNVKRIDDYAVEKYGEKLGKNWYYIDNRSYSETVVVWINHPPLLQQAYLAKDGVKTLSEINSDPQLPNVGKDFYMGDAALMEQENPLYDDLMAEFEEVQTINRGLELPTWNHDASKDKDVEISDEHLDLLINKKREC
ncbi:MAG: hypothetical protein ACW98K_00025 [Candidatus Kariarchaeaceae archaeon]|jgi:hypothetical protein